MTAAPVIDIPGLEDDDDEYRSKRRSDPSEESEEGLREGSADSHEDKYNDGEQQMEDVARRDSEASTDEAVIFDAYARESRSSSTSSESRSPSQTPSPEPSPPKRQPSLPPTQPSMPRSGSQGQDWFSEEQDRTPTQESVNDPLEGLRRPSPGEEFGETRPGAPTLPSEISLQVPSDLRGGLMNPTAPSQRLPSSQYELPPGMAPPAPRSSVPPGIALQQQSGLDPLLSPPIPDRPRLARTESGASTASSVKEKEKEKKGGFFSKKEKKDKKGKEKDGLFGSLFGGKKKQEEPSSIANFSSAGPAAAAALLGSSKSAKSLGLSPSASPTSLGFSNFARYPIHVERAVYRLSHIKLANARRPLYEQVLISNLMFWYLGIIGRNVAEEKKPNGVDEKKEDVKPAVKGTPPKATDSGVAGTPSVPAPAPKKTGLTKPDRSRGGRDNEAPVRTPSYGMQNAQVDNELRNINMSMSMKNAQRPQIQIPQQQYPSQHQSPQHQHFSATQAQSPQQGFSPHQRNPNSPQPVRAMSSPVSGGQPRLTSEAYPPQIVHRDVQPPPRGLPQSSFGPPPPVNGLIPQSQPMLDGRDPRQRTLSTPGPGQPSPPSTVNMRRVVTDGRPPYPPADGRERSPVLAHNSHAGPQPGQIFAYPGTSPQPGQIFQSRPPPGPGQIFTAHQPGQVFHHPHAHFNGQRPMPDQGRPGPGPQWEPPLRLPPGASPGPDHQYLGASRPHPQRRGPSPPGDLYDPHREQRTFGAYPPQGGPPQLGIPSSHSAGPGFYQSSPASTQPGQLFNPYPARSMPARQSSQDEMYRRAQAVPQGGPYGAHHR